ncbi:PhzF family phenazine biosynthesis protein [Acidovorax sp. RAC01]|uniref:PhzF family phenazine biosynthesis protein n=1 Tax=Acidovorax sp. RAC01 TaxID=1842533 RepID=UPI00083E8299|nr:PhzF family phenazine biosynthesis protein [Acidovorax sp. RAC01]AOG23482.1 phenazine biosynthesis, PhzF family protein [Acidovorax sp. RAC01]
MHPRAFKQIDVFTDRPGYGNPVAVVLDAQGLGDDDMRRFAAWTNLSETTFLMPPTPAGHAAGADYRVRIFSPNGELPFAGHPTLGTCHAWLQAGHNPREPGMVVQECALGLVRVQHAQGTLAFAAPALQRSAPSPALVPLIASALGLRPAQILGAQLLDNGPRWLGLLLDSADTVLNLRPDHARIKDLGQDVGVVHVGPEAADTSRPGVVVRAFAAPMGNPEDPVTGSLNASLAEWLIADGLAPRSYLVAQGECLGRAGRVQIRQDDTGQVWVGGHAVTCIEGTALL